MLEMAYGQAENNGLRLLILSDIHYVHKAPKTSNIPQRRTDLGIELIRQVRKKLSGTRIDAVVILGDTVDNGNAPGAWEDAEEVARAIDLFKRPVVHVAGNHDGLVLRTRMEGIPQPLIVQVVPSQGRATASPKAEESTPSRMSPSYALFSFHDLYDKQDKTRRSEEAMQKLLQVAQTHPERPIVALQHNPIYPRIQSSYPYMIENAESVMRAYERANVVLSLSGHYHPGQKAVRQGNVTYATCPALCEKPFRFLVAEVVETKVRITEFALDPPGTNSFMGSVSAP